MVPPTTTIRIAATLTVFMGIALRRIKGCPTGQPTQTFPVGERVWMHKIVRGTFRSSFARASISKGRPTIYAEGDGHVPEHARAQRQNAAP